jgi:hypothetical protein
MRDPTASAATNEDVSEFVRNCEALEIVAERVPNENRRGVHGEAHRR